MLVNKLLILIFLVVFYLTDAFSQPLLPVSSSKKEIKAKNTIDSLRRKLTNKNLSWAATDTIEFNEKKEVTYIDVPSLMKGIRDQIDTLNTSPPFIPFGTVGFNGLENPQNSFATASLGIRFRVSRFKWTKKNWVDPGYIYFEYRTRTALSDDSSVVQKTFIFPELSKRDYVLGFYQTWTKGQWDLSILGELSLNKYSDKKNEVHFTSQSAIAAFRANFNATNPAPLEIILMPYYEIINVDPKYNNQFFFILGEDNLPSTYQSVGLLSAFGPSSASFFCNAKYVFNNSPSSVHLRSFVYTIGIKAFIPTFLALLYP